MKIASLAQLRMFEQCLADPDYAQSRGISADAARQCLNDYRGAGSPALPERAAPAAASQRPSERQSAKATAPRFLQSRREG